MSTRTLHPLAADYVDRLRRAGRGLPRGRLKELVAEIEEHLSEAIGPEASDAEALTVLDRLGEPEEIVDAEEPGRDVPHRDVRGTKEWAAIILLLFGGFIFGIGWLAGLILLWSSRAWSTVDKWIGTLIVPGVWPPQCSSRSSRSAGRARAHPATATAGTNVVPAP
jgi:hypothetical protein